METSQYSSDITIRGKRKSHLENKREEDSIFIRFILEIVGF